VSVSRLILLLAAIGGCDSPICGDGTIERGRQCVVLVDAGPATCCGPGTHEDPELGCVPDEVRTCDACAFPVLLDDGLVHCFGHGDGCPVPCPPPGPGNVSVCGRMVDVETGASIDDGNGDGSPCDPSDPAETGPCSLAIRFYAALDLADGDAAELVPYALHFNNCGDFSAEVEEPSVGFLAVVVDDAAAADDHAAAVVVLPAQAGVRHDDVTLFGLRRTTDIAWTTAAGDPFAGQTFAQQGAELLLFRYGDDPVGGVTVGNGEVFYFADNDPAQRALLDPALTATAVNGAALRAGSMASASASGSEPDGCDWSPLPWGGTPGFVRVDDVHAVNDLGVCQP
jgi:hypothetical protein